MPKMKEGQEFDFFVEKEIETPDNKKHFVLSGPDQKKYLLLSERYTDYNIKPGCVIVCRVDKINCSGEIFLEPLNPWYKEGETYTFKVIAHETRIGITGSKQNVIIVTDIRGNQTIVPYNGISPLPALGSEIQLVVERITKGKLYLLGHSVEVRALPLVANREYDFLIEGTGKGPDDEDYYIIKDPFGNSHTLPKEYYEYYGFGIGTTFKGRIVKYRNNGEKTIEPENPYYKIGSVIKLKVISSSKNIVNDLFTLNLKDDFGFYHCIELKAPLRKKNIYCRVKMIKKGKPLLSPM
jgi:hypothetical protein